MSIDTTRENANTQSSKSAERQQQAAAKADASAGFKKGVVVEFIYDPISFEETKDRVQNTLI